MAISHQKIPHGGWSFYEERTRTTFKSVDFSGLVKCLEDHRKANALNHWDSEYDIEIQIEKNHPELSI